MNGVIGLSTRLTRKKEIRPWAGSLRLMVLCKGLVSDRM